jgi:hypothetical protein
MKKEYLFAFPTVHKTKVPDTFIGNKNTYKEVESFQEGMELRDYFAAKAMQGVVSALMGPEGLSNGSPDVVAQFSYQIADAMLRERAKP